MKRKSLMPSNIGIISLIMVFIVLCLVVFAVLSLSGTLREYRYAQQLAAHNTAYYEACNTAQRELSDVDLLLQQAAKEEAFEAALRKQLEKQSDLQLSGSGEDLTLSFAVAAGETQALSVSLGLKADGSYSIRQWKIISTSDWEADNRLHLIQGFEG